MTAKEILNKHIQDYLAKDRMARFEDVPERVFIEAMEHYHQAKLKLLGIADVSDLLIAWEQFKKANWWESDAVDVEKVLMNKFQAIYSG